MSEQLLQFPTHFPIKVMGENQEGFEREVVAIVQQHVPGFDPASLERRPSRNDKYIGLTCTVYATSQAQLDDLYRALTGHPGVKVVL